MYGLAKIAIKDRVCVCEVSTLAIGQVSASVLKTSLRFDEVI
jgi:hypothetical protein